MSDFNVKLEEARGKLPLRRMMEERGRAPSEGGKCAYCGKSGTKLFRAKSGTGELFKCHHASCSSGTAGEGGAWDEVGFLAYELSLSRKDAAITYLKEAGVWKEREAYAPSVMPGKAARKIQPPSEEEPLGDDEGLVLECLAIIREEQSASVSLIQRRLRLGYARAARIMAELEKRGFVGPANGIESREILTPPATPEDRQEPIADSQDLSKTAAAGGLLNADRSRPGDIPETADDAKRNGGPVGAVEVPSPTQPAGRPGDSSAEESQQSGGGASVSPDAAGAPGHTPPVAAPSPSAGQSEKSKPEIEATEPDGKRALKEFYSRLAFSEQNEAETFHKRGLVTSTSAALGFRSNPRSNQAILFELHDKYGFQEMERAGLWVVSKKSKERKPNWQFVGGGIIRKAKDGERASKGQWIMEGEDGRRNLCGWTEPILIPYFDTSGGLVGLRPHKGGGRAGTLTGTPRPYIPLPDKQFGPLPTVIITEGEFKAAALLQTVGVLRQDKKQPIGVASLPGITFGKHYELREMLDDWLRSVGCRRVIVAFDNEEHSDPKLESYKPQQKDRFAAQVWARLLATDLYKKVHVKGLVCTLPNEWRNEKGKADWDGALAGIVESRGS